MKGLIAQGFVFGIFATLILAFGIQDVVGAEEDTVPVAARFNIAISEIMYATNTNKSPQWIELHNRSGKKVSLEGWEVTIKNHPEDKSVLATTLTFTLDAKILDRNQVLLLVTEQGPNSGVGAAKGDLRSDRIVILKDLINGTPGYRLLSQTAFRITLMAAAERTRSRIPSDIAGNLGEVPEWKLPLIEGNQRSSIIREYDVNNATGVPYDGTAADGWDLTGKKGSWYVVQRPTYYGHRSDHGTPGYRAPTPLPVELSNLPVELSNLPVKLSKFRPERKKSSGEVIIRWITESEMNNAGFNILRSEKRNGEFTRVNTKLIAGQGTTSEKTIYEWKDTSAKRNVVYYYQIECVSVDGTRQTLRMSRLKGRVSDYRLFEVDPFWWRNLNP
ncbi:lamin tail domain-containing protein [Candidatus Poribacteria bacterium]|nr:lamin tail domain-containing protein [Candidatus Poribacteria bacterium]MYB02063.1 lamin tail domain-containing protein [Candidatus Poribacteria bacterium]